MIDNRFDLNRHPWFLYCLQCQDGSLYTGICKSVVRRVRQHNGELAGGAKYTQGRRPVQLLAWQAFVDQSAALQAELRFKKLSRPQKLAQLSHWQTSPPLASPEPEARPPTAESDAAP